MSVEIDKEFHVQLQYNGCMVLPLPWFVQGENAKSIRFSMLLNFPSYMKNNISENENSLFEELRAKQFYKLKGSLLSQLMLFVIRYI